MVYRVVRWQSLAALLVGGLWLFARGDSVAVAVACGYVAAVVPSVVMARILARPRADARLTLAYFYLGVIFKLLVTALVFVIAIAGLKAPFAPLVTVYGVTLLVYWLALPLAGGGLGSAAPGAMRALQPEKSVSPSQ